MKFKAQIALFIFCSSLATTPVIADSDKAKLVIDSGGHKATIRDLIFSRNGEQLFSISDDKTIQRWDVDSGERTALWRGQQGIGNNGKFYAGALSPNGRLLAVGGSVGPYTGDLAREDEGAHKIRLLNANTGQVIRLLKGHTNVINSLNFSSDSRYLASSGSDHTARLWDVKTGRLLKTFSGHSNFVYSVIFSPDDERIVTGSDDTTVKIWDRRSGDLLDTLHAHDAEIRSVTFTSDGEYLITSSYDKTIKLWDGDNGDFIKVLAEHENDVNSLAVSPDNTAVLASSDGGSTGPSSIYAIPSGKRLQNLTAHSNTVIATAYRPESSGNMPLVATGGGDNKEIHLWSPETGEIIHTLQGGGQTVWSVGFSPSGDALGWGQLYDQTGYDMYQINGPLQQRFHLPVAGSRSNDAALSIGDPISSDKSWARAVQQVGSISINTENGAIDKTLIVKKHDNEISRIALDSTNGYEHRSFTLTPDGQTVIQGGGNGNLTSYDVYSGEKVNGFIGHTGDVWSASTSPDGRLLVSGSSDQTIRLWKVDSGKLLLTIFPSSNGEWVAWTPEGYYTSSLNGDKLIGWHINRGETEKADYYPASQFASEYHQPAVVAAYVENGGYIKEAIASANRKLPRRKQLSTAKVNLESLLPPFVVIKNPLESVMTTDKASIQLNAEARSVNGEPIEQLWVTVNGKTPKGERAIKRMKQKSNAQRVSLNLAIQLEPGENRIAVMSKNQHSQSEPEIIRITYAAKTNNDNYAKPSMYVLAIGVSDYEDGSYNLDYADDDAKGVVKALKKQQGKLYRKVHSKVLTNKTATRGNILDGLDWLLEETTQHDTAIVFIAGHGMKDERNNYYFIPHDGNAEKLKRSAVNWFEFQDVLSGLPGTRLLLADTCHSGGITGKRRGSNQSDITDALRDLRTADGGVVVMAAATGNEVSVEHPSWGHGAFSKALIEGLGSFEADYNNDHRIDIKELDLFVTNRVKKLTKGKQHPTTEIPTIVPNFPVGLR